MKRPLVRLITTWWVAFAGVCVLLLLPAGVRAQVARWNSPGLSVARQWLSAATMGSRVFFAGGQTLDDTGPFSNVIDIFDAVTNSWSVTSLPLGPRDRMGVTSIGDKMVIFAGGHVGNSSTYTSRVEIYHAANKSWTTAALSVPRSYLVATSVGDVAVFAGGKGDQILYSTVDIYHSSNNTWTTFELSQPRAYLAATTVGDLAIFAGGWAPGAQFSAAVDIYNVSSNSWTQANLSVARFHPAATAVGSLAIFGGGVAYSGYVAAVDIYNAANNSWTTASLQAARGYGAAATSDQFAIFCGGYGGYGTGPASYPLVVDIYNAVNNTWTTTSISAPRWRLAGTNVGSLAIFGGGLGNGSMLATVDMFYNAASRPLMSPSPSLSPSSTMISDSTPILQIDNSTGLDVLIIPKDGRYGAQVDHTVQLGFGGVLRELDGCGSVLQEGLPILTGPWRKVNGSDLNASQSYMFSAIIEMLNATAEGVSNQSSPTTAMMEVQFYLFARRTPLPIDGYNGNVTFIAEPSLAKFSVRLFHWPWLNGSEGEFNKSLEMRIRITPPFTNFTRLAENPYQPDIASFILNTSNSHQDSDSGSRTLLRLLDVITLDGSPIFGGQGVKFTLDVDRSELVLRFARFESSLVYDPDMGVLFTPSAQLSSSDSSMSLIIGATLGISVGVLVIAAVIIGAAVLVHVRRKQEKTWAAQADRVNFAYDDEWIELQSKS